MLCVAVYAGLRVSEIVALHWRDVQQDSITIHERCCRGDLRAPKNKTGGTTIPVCHVVVDQIDRLRRLAVEVEANSGTRRYRVVTACGPDDLVFQSPVKGAPMRDNNVLARHIKPAARKLGLDLVNRRCLRTSHAIWLKMAGIDMNHEQVPTWHSLSQVEARDSK